MKRGRHLGRLCIPSQTLTDPPPSHFLYVHDPTQVSFTAKKTFCNISVEGVESVLDGSPIKYAAQALLATEEYVVE